MSSASIFDRGLKPVEISGYSINHTGLSIAPPPSTDSSDHRVTKTNSFIMGPGISVANEIERGIAMGNSIQRVQDGFEKSEYTPYAREQVNSIGQTHPAIFSNRIQKKAVNQAAQTSQTGLQIATQTGTQSEPTTPVATQTGPAEIPIAQFLPGAFKDDSGFATGSTGPTTTIITSNTDVVALQNNPSLNPFIHQNNPTRQEKRLLEADVRANVDKKDILRKLFVLGNT